MRKLIAWTVWNPLTRRPKRSGWIDESLIKDLRFDPDTERLLIGEAAVLREDEVNEEGKLSRIPQAVLDAERAAKLAAIEPSEEAVLLVALATKVGITPAELAAAKANLSNE